MAIVPHPTAARSAALPLLLALTLGAAGCGDPVAPVPKEITELPRQLTVTEQALVTSANAFGFDLFARVHAAETGPNVFLSPLSASMALGMTLNGAAGTTFDAMRTALHHGESSQEEINAAYRGLLDVLQDLDPRVRFRIANSIWTRQGFPVLPSFYDVLKREFDAEAEELNFSDPAAAERINGWVKDRTQGKIDEIVKAPIPPEVVMYLVNAMYFKGTWTERFDPSATRDRPFTRPDGSTVQAPLMHLETTLPYYENATLQAVELPYGGKAYSMVVVLPKPGHALGDLVASLDAGAWNALVDGLHETQVILDLPRFRFSYDAGLKDPLTAMGMGIAFDASAADFSRLTPGRAHISSVLQKTFVEVNEEGTEAAAVTVVTIGVTSAPQRVVMTVDRPFLFAIRERFSGTILFMGTIGDPTLEK